MRTALLGFVGAATAADLAPRFVPAPPAFTWTGVYVGASVGALFSDNNDDRGGPSTLSFPAGAGGPGSPFVAVNSAGGGSSGVPFGAPVSPLAGVPLPTATVVGLGSVCAGCGNDRDTSLVFGVQVGYNYQFSPGSGFVVGVEADAQFLGEQGSSNRRSPGPRKAKTRLVRDGSAAARICLRSLAGVRDRRACLFGRRSG